MTNWLQESLDEEEREGNLFKALEKPFGMVVESVSADTELAKFSFFGNSDRVIAITHPFVSTGSWIRAVPERGTSYVGSFRSDEGNPQPLTTFQRGASRRIQAFKGEETLVGEALETLTGEVQPGTGLYRPLAPGEIEVSSRGAGQAFFPRRPKVELRGGVIERWADQDRLTVGDRAPTHQKQYLQYVSGELGDESRDGVAYRFKPAGFSAASFLGIGGDFSTWEITYPRVRGEFAAEYFKNMKNPANEAPAVLFTLHKGHVLDDQGEQVLQTVSQVPLRSLEEYFANDDSSTRYEVDEKGNIYVSTATAAIEGYELNVSQGNYIKTVQLDETVTILGAREHAVEESAVYRIGDNFTMTVANDMIITSENAGASLIFDSSLTSEKIVMSSNSGHFFIMDDAFGAESIFLVHNSGAQFVIDSDGSARILSSDGCTFFMDSNNGAVSAVSASGAFITAKKEITIVDSTGSQIITMGGDLKDTIQISAAKDVIVNSQKTTIASGSIDLGAAATFSAVLAEQLAILFDTHTHAGVLGPTSPPLPPNTAALVNANPATAFAHSFIKMRGNLA